MRIVAVKFLIVLAMVAIGISWTGELRVPAENSGIVSSVEARVGRPATPVSYAGVARRTPVGVGTVGAGARGVGTQPANRGGAVNRVGRR